MSSICPPYLGLISPWYQAVELQAQGSCGMLITGPPTLDYTSYISEIQVKLSALPLG